MHAHGERVFGALQRPNWRSTLRLMLVCLRNCPEVLEQPPHFAAAVQVMERERERLECGGTAAVRSVPRGKPRAEDNDVRPTHAQAHALHGPGTPHSGVGVSTQVLAEGTRLPDHTWAPPTV